MQFESFHWLSHHGIFDAMEQHLGSTLYSGLVKGVSTRNGDLNDDL